MAAVQPVPPTSGRPAAAAPSPPRRYRHGALYVLILTMHVTVSLYLGLWIAVFLFARGVDISMANVHSPITAVATYGLLIALHVHACAATIFPASVPRIPLPTNRFSTVALKDPLSYQPSDPTNVNLVVAAGARRQEIQDRLVILFNLFEIACQSHQAHAMFRSSVEPVKVISYGLVVVLYSFASPLFLFVRSVRTKTTLLNLADAVVSFTLSTGHPLFSLVIALIYYVVVDPNLAQDNLWATRSMLFARLLVPSSAFDLVCKLGMHLGTFVALRRAISAIQLLQLRKQSTVLPITIRSRNRWLLRVNLVVNVGWSVVLLVSMCAALGFRKACPPYCLAESSPLWDLSCECAYAHVNCAKLGVADPVPLLSPALVGSKLFYLQISHCAVPNGLPPESLAPFSNLGKIAIVFSNLSKWDGPLPPSVAYVAIRFSPMMASIPQVLQGPNLSPHLVIIVIEGCPLRVIPGAVIDSWKHIIFLTLVNVGLEEFPENLGHLPLIESLNMKGNQLSSLPESLASPFELPNVRRARFSWNNFTQIPPALALRSSVVVELVGNPIESAANVSATAIEERRIVLDGTPYCATMKPPSACRPVCGHGCTATWVGDHYCDLACFTSECDFDGGDCDELGLERPS